jgi:hypothetical protein
VKVLATSGTFRVDVGFGDGTPAYLTEWLANVPARLWADTTYSWRDGRRIRRRAAEIVDFSMADLPGFAGDHVQIQLGLPTLSSVSFGVVDRRRVEGASQVSDPGFLEFWPGPEGLPDDVLRNSVRRSLEFLFGRGLAVVGFCEWTADHQPIRVALQSPYVAGGLGAAEPPALLHAKYLDGVDADVVGEFVRSYVRLQGSLHLNQSVWLYLHARNAPLDMKAAYLGAAFESLRRNYYKLPSNEERARIIPKEKWRPIMQQLRAALPAELLDQQGTATYQPGLADINERIGDLNKVSGTKLNTQLLEDLGFDFSEFEREALAARNDAAHANPIEPGEEWGTLKKCRALQTVFGRVMLGIVSGPTHYFDYGTEGFPVRRLPESQGRQ